ncbi:class I SAM-dependent methyltransferase, partial [Streptosporangium algeriense]
MGGPSAFPGINPESVARRASSFGGQAEAYARERPDYPDAAVLWALEPVMGHEVPRVLDLGAGTGKLTEVLLRHVTDVVAVEPDSAMLRQFRARLPRVEA